MNSKEHDNEIIAVGMQVTINPQSDRSRKKLVTGVVDEILTKAESHTHGILVRLVDGEVGRVKQVVTEAVEAAAQERATKNTALSGADTTLSLKETLKNGEDHFSEFKSSMLWSYKYSQEQIKESKSSEVKQFGRYASLAITAKTIAGFLNADGGTLLIGVKENKHKAADEVIGIESEFGKIKDPCADGYRRALLDFCIKPYFPSFIFNHFNAYIEIKFEEIDGKEICGILAKPSDAKVFLKLQNKDRFFVGSVRNFVSIL